MEKLVLNSLTSWIKLENQEKEELQLILLIRKILTQKFQITIIDAPGHKDFVKNMITGASQADAAFLVVAAPTGVEPQTKEHLWLLRTMGVQNVAVINQQDGYGSIQRRQIQQS